MRKFDMPPPVKLVCGLLYREESSLERGLADLSAEFGNIDFRSRPLPFHYTDYYFREMGEPLYRMFASFTTLIDPSGLCLIKLRTNSLEERYASSSAAGKRVLNIDPGYLTPAAYILATSKNYSHRIYLGKGVFAQQELLFDRKRVHTLDWTYPDYRSYEYQEILRKIRQTYLHQLKSMENRAV